MQKKSLLAVSVAFIISSISAYAEIQSPIYTDDIGRSHFLGRGGYSSVRQVQMGQAQADFVKDAVDKYSNVKDDAIKKVEEKANIVEENTQQAETDITNVIKEKSEVPVARQKATFTSEKRQMDPSAPYGYGNTYIPNGVNESKTLYTDELGRLHFFGKSNKTTETIIQK